MTLDTKTISAKKIEIKSIMSNFWFVIPEYQRSYVWDTDNINDLLDDLHYAYTNKYDYEYFLGSLVLRKTNQNNYEEFEVLDGQQRLTTFFLLMAVIRDLSQNTQLKEVAQKRIYQEKNEFDGIPERVRIVYKIRDDVESFIKDFILQLDGTTREEELNELTNSKNVSISNMSNAILTMRYFFNNGKKNDVENFSKYFPIKGVFISVSTDNMEDAFRMFTILNNRGIPLTNADILKSTNIGKIEDEDSRQKYASQWEQIEGDLGDDFDRFLSFFRTALVKEKARANLLEEFEENIYKKGLLIKGKPTIDLLKDYKKIYDTLIKFDNFDINNDYKNLTTIMQIGLPSGDWIPPILYFYKKFGKNQLLEFLKKLEFKFVGDWILQFTPTQRIESMNDILKSIDANENSDIILNDISLFKVDRNSLKMMLDQEVYGRRFARYILLKYEYLISDNTVHLSDYKTISVEHILPQNPNNDSKWVNDFSVSDREYWTHRLANLVLISKRKNSKLSNLDFLDKKDRYLRSRIDVFNGSKIFVKHVNQWTIEELKTRQTEMLSKLIE